MWPQQQQQPPQGQYPNYAYNNNMNMPPPPVPPMQQPLANYIPSPMAGHMGNINETAIDASFKRQNDGPILWFAGPPLNVIPEKEPIHSIRYLHWKSQNANK